MLRVLRWMEGAHARRGGSPEAVFKPWRGWDEKKGVHPPLVTIAFLWAGRLQLGWHKGWSNVHPNVVAGPCMS